MYFNFEKKFENDVLIILASAVLLRFSVLL